MSFWGKYKGSAWCSRDGNKVDYDAHFEGYADNLDVEKELARTLPDASSRATQRCIDAVDNKKIKLDWNW